MEFGREYASGVFCFLVEKENLSEASRRIETLHGGGRFGFALAYFSKPEWVAEDVISLMKNCAEGLLYAACSTAGELTPGGITEGTLMVILFPKKWFQFDAFEIDGYDGQNIENVVGQVHENKKNFFYNDDDSKDFSPFVICIMDGMSYTEEAIAAALHWGLDDIPLIGGSAGDNLNFTETTLLLNGKILTSCAIILMVKSRLPFQIFKTENFVPTTEKLVVTKSDPDKRIVLEFNGARAAEVYAEMIGSDPNNLAPQSFASHPLVVKVGGEYYCRSIQKVNDDGSLTFFCAIDDGIVLTVARPTGMAHSTDTKLEEVSQELGDIDFVLGFDCVLRRLDARNRQVMHKISKVYQKHNVIGFNTYGEQYRSMHLNQTLTGVAFSTPELTKV